MGTYTTNYQLYMPTVGETGWGTLVNANFTTIDTTIKGLSNRITAVENEVNGALSCTSVTTSGKITGNGGIAGTTGTFSGAVTGTSFNGALKNSGTITVTPTSQFYAFWYATFDMTVLPPAQGSAVYTGSLKIKNTSSSDRTLYYLDGLNSLRKEKAITANSTTTISFSGVKWLHINGDSSNEYLTISGFTLS